MILLENNGESLDDGNCKLHKVLGDIHGFLLALPPNVIFRKLHLLKESFEDILRHSIPIVYSCYVELTEVDISAEFNCVLELIKHIESEAIEMKLYYVPRIDDSGFLEFLLGYLEDLMKNQEILLRGEIDVLHVEVDILLSFAKLRNQEELDKNPWNDIMNLAYQAEYIIDLYLLSSPRDLGLISSLSKIIQQLHNIRADWNRDLSRLCQSLPAPDVAAETSKPPVIGLTTQVKDNDGIVGLQEETKNVMEHLLKGENKLIVVSIIGMAGVGKTTLALTLYNTPSMAYYFDIRARCVVSQSYQLRALLVSLLDQVDASGKSHISDDEELAEHFCKSLRKRRYFVILDDVWDIALWNNLKSYLPDDGNGSRILITTKNREVAGQIESKVNELHGLSDEYSWELFQKKMPQIESLSDDLLTISEGIVKNCKGLPLSIVIVAGVLSSIERTEEKWNHIEESVNSFVLSEPQGNCRAILELSYNHLPDYLRSCFLYLGSFPEDQEISVNRLILLWIGEGFVLDTEMETAEEVAKKYVEDLSMKSLVIPAKTRSLGGVKTFRLHDLLRDFCSDKAKEKHFFTLLGDEVFIDNGAFHEINHSLALPDPRRIIMSGSSAETSKPLVIGLTTPVIYNDGIVGFQEVTKNIMEDLLKGENKLIIVPIIGTAGVGKTTLALALYNSPSTADHFDIRARCVVPQSYRREDLLVSLLDQVNASGKSHISDDEELADRFCKSLRKRRYFIILEDVWDTSLWEYLKPYLPDDGNGSRILITTRYWDVADHFESKVNKLSLLSEEYSWELFQKKMPQLESLSDDLLTISKGIVKICYGLPLAIVIAAGILSSIERTVEKWNHIEESVNSFDFSQFNRKGCWDIIELSYNHLPDHLRSCFLYLGSFPENKEISVSLLILLWIGEGFVRDTEMHTAEEIAKKYIEYLIMKSLVIPVKKRSGGEVETFRLHDILRDFCLVKANEKKFYKLLVDFSFHSVRSMICHGILDTFEIKKRIRSCDMVLLRVLEVEEACLELFSIDHVWRSYLEDISSLVHLRYLAIHWGPWSRQDSVLTSSISKLQNLRILILKFAHFKVPDFIWDMVKLRHVHIHEASFEVDSNRLQDSSALLENLTSLSRARVSYGDSEWLSKLLGLQRLCCLFTTDDQEVDDVAATDNVTEVSDHASKDEGTEVDDNVKHDQSRMLSFNRTLVSLKVKNRPGRVQRFISTCQLPKSLQKLTLSYFSLESNDISRIGQTLTHLEVFKIYSCGVPSGYEWNADDGNFPKLKVLKLKHLKICNWIASENSFPNL